jgi:hypothetical protein
MDARRALIHRMDLYSVPCIRPADQWPLQIPATLKGLPKLPCELQLVTRLAAM